MSTRRRKRGKKKRTRSGRRGHWLGAVLGAIALLLAASLAQYSSGGRATGYEVRGGNELSVAQLAKIFAAYGSPLHAGVVFALGEKTGLDDIAFVAFALKETRLATTGVGVGLRNPTGTECDLSLCDTCAPGKDRSWCDFASVDQGSAAWYTLIARSYVTGAIDGGGPPLDTPYLIACGPDGQGMYLGSGGCGQYADDIQSFEDGWRSGKVFV